MRVCFKVEETFHFSGHEGRGVSEITEIDWREEVLCEGREPEEVVGRGWQTQGEWGSGGVERHGMNGKASQECLRDTGGEDDS